MKKINNNIKPTSPINNTKKSKTNPDVLFDFIQYPNWTHSVRIGEYTNELKSEKDCSKQFYKLISKLLPYIQSEGKNIFNATTEHCHLLQKEKRELAVKIIEKIHNLSLPEETEIWQLGYSGGTRIVGTLISGGEEDKITIYPLFIDHHHLIYASQKHNAKDLTKKACKFIPQNSYQ